MRLRIPIYPQVDYAHQHNAAISQHPVAHPHSPLLVPSSFDLTSSHGGTPGVKLVEEIDRELLFLDHCQFYHLIWSCRRLPSCPTSMLSSSSPAAWCSWGSDRRGVYLAALSGDASIWTCGDYARRQADTHRYSELCVLRMSCYRRDHGAPSLTCALPRRWLSANDTHGIGARDPCRRPTARRLATTNDGMKLSKSDRGDLRGCVPSCPLFLLLHPVQAPGRARRHGSRVSWPAGECSSFLQTLSLARCRCPGQCIGH